MLTILTKPSGIHPFNSEWAKYYAGKITGKRRGPEMVAQSLSRGLCELNVAHQLNPFFINFTKNGETIHVINGAKTLKWALTFKKTGKIKKLIVGPAISVVPADHDSILSNPLIDKIVFPGQWTKDFFASIDPSFKEKIEIWPAGVQSKVTVSSRKNGIGIVYAKFITPEMKKNIIDRLDTRKMKYEIFEYGTFKQADYFAALEKSDWMIYLSPSESQGIALQEAWIRDVPTLVWDVGVWNYKTAEKTYSWKTPLVSAPYLSSESGMAFSNTAGFSDACAQFMQNISSFSPRAYCMKALTDIKIAKRFLEIIGQK
jgi:hypothetical protein